MIMSTFTTPQVLLIELPNVAKAKLSSPCFIRGAEAADWRRVFIDRGTLLCFQPVDCLCIQYSGTPTMRVWPFVHHANVR